VNMHLQPPNGNMNPAPFMLAPQEPEEVGFDFWGVLRRRKWLVFLGMLAGLVVGGIYNSQAQKVYESKATVTIEPRAKIHFEFGGSSDQFENISSFDVRHDQLISEDNILSKCLVGGLGDLETLRDLSPTDQILEIQENLVVAQNREEFSKYELVYTSVNPRDAQNVLAKIVATYQKHLEEKYRIFTADTMELLNKMVDQFQRDEKMVGKKLQAARDEVDKHSIAGNAEHLQRLIAEMMDKIEQEKAQLSELTSDLARSEEALEEGRDNCLQHIWILERAGKIPPDSMQVLDHSQEIAAKIRTIEGLELQREQLRLEHLGPKHTRMQVVNLAIDEQLKKVEELGYRLGKVFRHLCKGR